VPSDTICSGPCHTPYPALPLDQRDELALGLRIALDIAHRYLLPARIGWLQSQEPIEREGASTAGEEEKEDRAPGQMV